MGKKKSDYDVLKPFCYYWDREYDTKETLLEHQKNRHFSCLKCHKKFSTAASMSTHMISVHRETLARVPNAKTGRDSLDVTIYGMEGMPAIFDGQSSVKSFDLSKIGQLNSAAFRNSPVAEIIREKLLAKFKKKKTLLMEQISGTMDLKKILNPTNIKELEVDNEYYRLYKGYTSKMEIAAGVKFQFEQPTYEQQYPPPFIEEEKLIGENKRDAKLRRKQEEEAKEALPIIMKDEVKDKYLASQLPTPVNPDSKGEIGKSKEVKETKDGKKKAKMEVMVFVSSVSPEEKRAKLDKYRYDEKKIRSELKNLKMNIQDKLAALKNKS